MPKCKTRKAFRDRVKVTKGGKKGGKLLHDPQNMNHKRSVKSTSHKRRLTGKRIFNLKAQITMIKKALGI